MTTSTRERPGLDDNLGPLSELVAATGVDDHVRFARQALGLLPPSESLNGLVKGIASISERAGDSRLYMAVIGEFSSGKSTFINAILRDSLLRSGTRPTTAAATWIEHGPELDLRVEYEDGRVIDHRRQILKATPWSQRLRGHPAPGETDGRLREMLARVTVDEGLSQGVGRVVVRHPAVRLAEGLVLIDTPGANAVDEHAVVTRRVLEHDCDGAIVLVPADQPVSMSLVDFLAQHLSGVLHRCMFLVTRIDAIRAKERAKLLTTIEQRLGATLGLDAVTLFAAAPVFSVPGEIDDGEIDEARLERLRQEFGEVETRLLERLREDRARLVVDRLLSLLESLLRGLEDALRSAEASQASSHRALIENMLPDLHGFARERRDRLAGAVRVAQERGRQSLSRAKKEAQEDALAHLANSLDACTSVGQLKERLAPSCEEAVALFVKAMNDPMHDAVKQMETAAQEAISNFEREFEKIFRSLAVLGAEVGKIEAAHVEVESRALDLDKASKVVTDAQGKEGLMGLGGAGAGAVIGTMILPGVGTVVGGIIGGIAGAFFGPAVDDVRREVRPKARRVVKDAIERIEETIDPRLDAARDRLERRQGQIVDAYLAKYEQVVHRLQEADRQAARALERTRAEIRRTCEELKKKRAEVARWSTRLRERGRGAPRRQQS